MVNGIIITSIAVLLGVVFEVGGGEGFSSDTGQWYCHYYTCRCVCRRMPVYASIVVLLGRPVLVLGVWVL